MDLMGSTLTIASVITIMGIIISVLNYNLNKKKSTNEEEEREKANEARLVAIEKDIQYIRMSVDGINSKLDAHEQRLINLEKK